MHRLAVCEHEDSPVRGSFHSQCSQVWLLPWNERIPNDFQNQPYGRLDISDLHPLFDPPESGMHEHERISSKLLFQENGTPYIFPSPHKRIERERRESY